MLLEKKIRLAIQKKETEIEYNDRCENFHCVFNSLSIIDPDFPKEEKTKIF